MSGLFVESQPVRIDLDPDTWVSIKPEMSIGDHEDYQSQMMVMDVISEDTEALNRRGRRALQREKANNPKQQVSIRTGEVELLSVNIVSWSADIPVTKENIAKLKPEYVERIIEEIDSRNSFLPTGKSSSLEQGQMLDTKTSSNKEEAASPTRT